MEKPATRTEQFYRKQSYWLDTVPGSLDPRSPLSDDSHADVVIIGAGYTGLWTAYYLKRHAPDQDIAILEAEIAGFGASGRNGGWCTSYLSCLEEQMTHPATRDAAIHLQHLMFDAVDEVGRVSEREAFDCHFDRGGHVAVATRPAHLARDRKHIEFLRTLGFGAEHIRWLAPDELRQWVNADRVLGGFHMPHCVPIHPARLARGLAETVERHGVRLYERSAVTEVGNGQARTAQGSISAGTILIATEGYTGSLPEVQRKLIPVHSTMIATEPLTEDELAATALQRGYTFNNGKHLVTYGQLTADGRIAFGSRGRYLYQSGIQNEFRLDDPAFDIVAGELAEIFPVLRGKRYTHAWGGPMGVSRSLTPAVCYDGATRVGWAGGFFGDGVGATNLAGRTLADLVLRRDTERSRALWVNPEREKSLVRRLWEPEPVRWLGIKARAAWMGWTDQAEARGGSATAMNWVLEKVFPSAGPRPRLPPPSVPAHPRSSG